MNFYAVIRFLKENFSKIKRLYLFFLATFFICINKTLFAQIDIINFSDFIKYSPIEIKSIEQTPQNPSSEDEVKVKLKIKKKFWEEEDLYLDTATLSYTTNDWKTSEEIEFEEVDENILEVFIPKQEEHIEVKYVVKILDLDGNVTLEIPNYEPKEFNEESKPSLDKSTELFTYLIFNDSNKKDSVIEKYARLSSKYFTISIANEVDPHVDITSLFFSYDENHYYFKFNFLADIESGTVSPTKVNIYAFALSNGRIKKTDETALSTLWGWIYAPHISLFNYPSCALIHLKGKTPVIETQGFSFNIEKNEMFVSLDRKFIGENLEEELMFVAFSMQITSLQPPFNGIIQDISPTALIYLREHSYEVKK